MTLSCDSPCRRNRIIYYVLMMLIPIEPIQGGFSPEKSSPRKQFDNTISECVYHNQKFEFIITATNFPQLPFHNIHNKRLLQLNFALAPINNDLLRSSGFWYSGYTEISRTGGRKVNSLPPIHRSTILAGSRVSSITAFSGATTVIDKITQGRTMPIWGLSYFLYHQSILNQLIQNGLFGPCLVTEPILLGSHPIPIAFLGFSANPAANDVIRRRYFFGNSYEIAGQYSGSIQADPPGSTLPKTLAVHSNIKRLASSPKEGDAQNLPVPAADMAPSTGSGVGNFFFLIGLTRSGQWGLLVIVFGSYYLEAIRKDLYIAMLWGKKDFDPSPPGAGGASGMTTTTVK